ncbi:hypothetical protein HDZ31DRAFT_40146 [Schizophyllum fasciatum]
MRVSAVVLPTMVSAALAAPRPRQEYCDMQACLNDLRMPDLPACEGLTTGDNFLSQSAVLVEQVLCLRSAYSLFEYASFNCEPCMDALGIPDNEGDVNAPWTPIKAPSDVDHPMYQAMASEATLFRAEDALLRMEALEAERELRQLRKASREAHKQLAPHYPPMGHLLRSVLSFALHW